MRDPGNEVGFFVAARRRSIKSVLERFKLCVSLNQSWTKAFSAKICIVSSKGTFVAMGSPLGPLLANVFMCSIEENLEQQGQLPRYYRR